MTSLTSAERPETDVQTGEAYDRPAPAEGSPLRSADGSAGALTALGERRTSSPAELIPAAHAPPRAWLRVLNGEDIGTDFELVGLMSLGRSTGCAICINDPNCSRRHASLRWEDGNIIIEDTDSQNGTWVNNTRISRCCLREGDVLRVGTTRLHFRREERSSQGGVIWVELPDDPLGFAKPVQSGGRPNLGSMSIDAYYTALGIADNVGQADVPRLREQTRKFAVLFELSQQMQRNPVQVEALLLQVLNKVAEVIDADRGVLALIDADEELQPRVIYDPQPTSGEAPRIVMSRRHCDRVVNERCGIIVIDVQADESLHGREAGLFTPTRCLMMVPVIASDVVFGVLEFSCLSSGQRFVEEDLDLTSIVAGMIGSTLENHRLLAEKNENIEELRRAQSDLERAFERIIEQELQSSLVKFAKGMVHEVQNHLHPIYASEELKERFPDDPEVASVIDLVLDASTSIVGLVREFRQFASGTKEEPGNDKLPLVDVGEVLNSAIGFAKWDPDLKDIDLRLVLVPSPRVPMDKVRIRQCLLNLIRNAAHAMPPETVAAGRATIELRLVNLPNHVRIEVRDNGKGMPLDIGLRVFEPFMSFGKKEGMGIGLEICRAIVSAHGGSIDFDSWPGCGSTFRVDLPLRPARKVELTCAD